MIKGDQVGGGCSVRLPSEPILLPVYVTPSGSINETDKRAIRKDQIRDKRRHKKRDKRRDQCH